MTITKRPFGTLADGREVTCYTMENPGGLRAEILDFGCTVRSLTFPDRNGERVETVLGYDDLDGYVRGSSSFGAFVGRYANRIRGARFTLDGREYVLSKNDGNNHLHGNFGKELFAASVEEDTLVLRRTSPDGEEGYPGTLEVEVRCRVTADDALELTYLARTDAPTVLNLTNHSYFNLGGGGDVLDHELFLDADAYLEVNGETIPTGRILPVAGTPMDFRTPRAIGDTDWFLPHRGYDHSYALPDDGALRTAARVFCPRTGIELTCRTTQCAVQLYTGNYVDEDAAPCGRNGVRYPRYAAVCLETQHHPCSPNFPQFPTSVLRPGETYRQTTVYRFSVR